MRGKIGARAIGNFTYKKTTGQTADDPNYEVKIFPLLVRRQSASWPEFGAARGSVGRSGEGDFAHPGTGAEGDRGEVCKSRGRRGKQTHFLTLAADRA